MGKGGRRGKIQIQRERKGGKGIAFGRKKKKKVNNKKYINNYVYIYKYQKPTLTQINPAHLGTFPWRKEQSGAQFSALLQWQGEQSVQLQRFPMPTYLLNTKFFFACWSLPGKSVGSLG